MTHEIQICYERGGSNGHKRDKDPSVLSRSLDTPRTNCEIIELVMSLKRTFQHLRIRNDSQTEQTKPLKNKSDQLSGLVDCYQREAAMRGVSFGQKMTRGSPNTDDRPTHGTVYRGITSTEALNMVRRMKLDGIGRWLTQKELRASPRKASCVECHPEGFPNI